MCDLGHHGVASLLDTSLEVGMTVASLINYYKLQLKDVGEVTGAMIELYYDWLYATGDDKPTVAEAKKLQLVHEHMNRLRDEPTSAKAHGQDSVKQRTDLAQDV